MKEVKRVKRLRHAAASILVGSDLEIIRATISKTGKKTTKKENKAGANLHLSIINADPSSRNEYMKTNEA